ncbi:hypothetical protein GCM10023235_06880 [Kitasatospora terrestris]|uniref:Uncharacterized protein n=1 Tax=Kitasatospora terrestris TaxID=258051 RepID=A0ABP9D8M8_9ACTN
MQTLRCAPRPAVTFADGGDDTGVHVPVFATAGIGGIGGMGVYAAVFLVRVAVWCFTGKSFATRPVIAEALARWGHVPLPRDPDRHRSAHPHRGRRPQPVIRLTRHQASSGSATTPSSHTNASPDSACDGDGQALAARRRQTGGAQPVRRTATPPRSQPRQGAMSHREPAGRQRSRYLDGPIPARGGAAPGRRS